MAPERHPLPNCKQASLLNKTSWDSGLSTSTGSVTARDQSREGSLKKERSFQTPGNTFTGESVARLGTSEGNITRRKKKKLKPTDYVLN